MREGSGKCSFLTLKGIKAHYMVQRQMLKPTPSEGNGFVQQLINSVTGRQKRIMSAQKRKVA